MESISFQTLPENYKLTLNQIPPGIFYDLYSNFAFSYLSLKNHHQSTNLIENYLLNYLKKFNLICYKLENITSNNEADDISSSKYVNAIICVENHCLIIKSINFNIITNVLQQTRSKLINTTEKMAKTEITTENRFVMEEIKNFSKNFTSIIKENSFIEHTINPILSFSVRRYFCPTYYFEDPSFFLFNHQKISKKTHQNYMSQIFDSFNIKNSDIETLKKMILNESQDIQNHKFNDNDYIKFISFFENENNITFSQIMDKLINEPDPIIKDVNEKLRIFIEFSSSSIISYLIRKSFYPEDYFINQDIEQTELPYIAKNNLLNNSSVQIHEFKEEDFITLRTTTKETTFFKLVMHIKSLYIFMMKVYLYPDDNEREINHEKYICENCAHRCLTPIYGCLKKGDKIIGFIYEYMSNNSLDNFIKKYNLDENYSIMLITRIFQGIDYLHNNSIIHRDIKPNNILVNHDFIPFLSDFDNIRHPTQDNSPFTNNIGSTLYTAPEQDSYLSPSYSSDIYSFGLIIYFIFEKKDWTNSFLQDEIIQSKKQEKIPPTINSSINIQNLYQRCIAKKDKRIIPKEIKDILYNKFISLNCFADKNPLKKILSEFFQKFYSKYNVFFELFFNLFYYQYTKNKKDFSNICYLIGILYDNGLGTEKDYIKAIKYYELSAQQNNSYAQYCLGNLYEKGLGVKQDYAKSRYYYELSAQQNNSYGLNNLGLLYHLGLGIEKDYLKALEYLKSSYHQKNLYATLNLGIIYKDCNKNYKKARKYYELLAQKNIPVALNTLGHFYCLGLGVEKDYKKAREYYELSARQNNSTGLQNLGTVYLCGYGVEKNYEKAKIYFELASQQNDLLAITKLGVIYFNGLGVKQDYILARKYFEIAAQHNILHAYMCLGIIYLNGFGVKQDFILARKYFEIARYNNSYALYYLGDIYYNGFGVKQNYDKAINYYELAAQQNNLEAIFCLGVIYAERTDIELNYSKAKYYFEILAKKNHIFGYIFLAFLYIRGYGVEKNYSKANEYYKLSANIDRYFTNFYFGVINLLDGGDKYDYLLGKYYLELAAKENNSPDVLYLLGTLYYQGHGVDQDYIKAKEYFELASLQNHPDSFNKLGKLYYYGKGVEQNFLKSKYYYEKASLLNYPKSFLYLGNLYYYGKGVKKDYLTAKYYYELAEQRSQIEAIYHLGQIYSVGDFFEIDINKAEKYFLHCIKSDTKNSKKPYCYFSSNDLGLIYLTYHNDIENAKEFIKKAAFAEYQFAQNNLGLIYQLYFDEIENAEYMYNRCLEHKFNQSNFIKRHQNMKMNHLYFEMFKIMIKDLKFHNYSLFAM